MAVNIAFTSPVNESGLTPLSAADVWAGIVLSLRRPQDFVDYISHIEILEDTGNTLRRVLHFVPGGAHNAPGGKLDQNVIVFPDYKVLYRSSLLSVRQLKTFNSRSNSWLPRRARQL